MTHMTRSLVIGGVITMLAFPAAVRAGCAHPSQLAHDAVSQEALVEVHSGSIDAYRAHLGSPKSDSIDPQ